MIIFTIINSRNNINLDVNVVDLEDEEGNGRGTRVELFIPLQ